MNYQLIACCAAAVALLAASADAQPGRGGRGGVGFTPLNGGGVSMLLMNEDIRDEVGIDREQLDRLEQLRRDMMEDMRDRFQGMRDLSPEERREAFEDMRQEMEDLRAEAEESIGSVLSESQMKRLRQIELQQQVSSRGAQALLSGAIAEKLGITPEQQEEMRSKAQQEQEKLAEQIRKLTEESRERVLAVLSESQRAQLKELMGEQYDMPQPQWGRRGGPGRNRPSRGGPRPELE